ncbi:MAG: hypothetical protein JWP89_4156 [Schlesneria sp.]|nr:hypothetical protein [Schlesneria sp.]
MLKHNLLWGHGLRRMLAGDLGWLCQGFPEVVVERIRVASLLIGSRSRIPPPAARELI